MKSSDNTPARIEECPDDLALRYVLGSLDEAERKALEQSLGRVNEQAQALIAGHGDVVADVTAALLPAKDPPPALKQRVLDAIRARHLPESDSGLPPHVQAMTLAADDLPWMATPYRGVRIRELSTASPDYSILMLACDPGTSFPPHDHAGSEDVYILSGDACIDGRVLRAGDFMHAEPGSHHSDMLSPSGCRALLITSRKNYSPRAARAYNLVHRVVKRIGTAFGVTVRD